MLIKLGNNYPFEFCQHLQKSVVFKMHIYIEIGFNLKDPTGNIFRSHHRSTITTLSDVPSNNSDVSFTSDFFFTSDGHILKSHNGTVAASFTHASSRSRGLWTIWVHHIMYVAIL